MNSGAQNLWNVIVSSQCQRSLIRMDSSIWTAIWRRIQHRQFYWHLEKACEVPHQNDCASTLHRPEEQWEESKMTLKVVRRICGMLLFLRNAQDLLSEWIALNERRCGEQSNTDNNLLAFVKKKIVKILNRTIVRLLLIGRRRSEKSQRWHLIYFTAVWIRWTVVRRICGMLLFLRSVKDLLSEWTAPYERRFGEQSNIDNHAVRKSCDSVERVMMGDRYRYRNDTNKLRHFQVVDVFIDYWVFLERRRSSPQTSARQMLHPEYRGSNTGDASLCAAAAETWNRDPFVSKHNENQFDWRVLSGFFF